MTINIEPFKFKHLRLLLDMHASQNYMNISSITMKTLPKSGYIALMNGQPVAAGFLRRVEPCYAQIDTLVSNAYLGSIIRHEGIEKVVDELLAEAKRMKLEGIISMTSDTGVLSRAKLLGFHIVPQTVIAIKL